MKHFVIKFVKESRIQANKHCMGNSPMVEAMEELLLTEIKPFISRIVAQAEARGREEGRKITLPNLQGMSKQIQEHFRAEGAAQERQRIAQEIENIRIEEEQDAEEQGYNIAITDILDLLSPPVSEKNK